MRKFKFLILGSEARQIYLEKLLLEQGHQVVRSEDYIDGSYDAFLLPVPTSAVYYEKIKDRLEDGQYIFGCNIPADPQRSDLVTVVEYMKSDSVAYMNAIATAEGTIAEAIRLSNCNLHGSRALVTGYGRCGEILAQKLKGLNCQVTIMDRKQVKRAKARAYGFDAISFELEELKKNAADQYEFLFNTVPGQVLGESLLSCFSTDICILDIASRPGGIDYAYCNKNGINATLLPGLPGKYAPKTSSAILMEVINQSMCNLEE